MQQHLPAPPLGIMPEGRMPQRLLELVKNGDLDGFEARCLELLETSALPLTQLPKCFELIAQAGQADRIATLGQMVFENIPPGTAPAEILPVACAALGAVPRHEDIRRTTIELYKEVHGQTPGFNAIMESSGLTTGGAARTALRVLDFCLSLKVGDTLISHMDDRVVEVKEVDRDRGLFTLRRDDRTTTLPAREVIREYDRVMAEDFRVLRQLYPERLAELINDKPVALVIGLIRAHGDLLDADQLKHELVPKYIEQKNWSKWWTRARSKLRRDPHVVIEGRSPVVLSYTAAGISHEDETWEAFLAQKEPVKWVKLVSGYLREQHLRKQPPDSALLERFRDHILQHVATVRAWRAGEALAAALVLQHLGAQGIPGGDAGHAEVTKILQSAAEPARLINELTDDMLWNLALDEFPRARSDDWVDSLVKIIPQVTASRLDALVKVLGQQQRLDAIQQLIDDALADPVDAPEIIYWLWKGPKNTQGLNLPTDVELFRVILDTLSALGATLAPPPEVGRKFRNRIKAALGLRNYAKVIQSISQVSAAAAVTVRRQLDRLEGLGDNAPARMLDILQDAHPQLWVRHIKRIESWADPDVLWATAAGLKKRTDERDELVNVSMVENAKRIGEAAARGDLSENSEYKFALEERDLLRARLAQINRELSLAQTFTEKDVPEENVGVGSCVKLKSLTDGAERSMRFLGPFETDVDNGVFNYKAPVSQILMGLHVGDHAILTIDGQEQEFEIMEISNALSRS